MIGAPLLLNIDDRVSKLVRRPSGFVAWQIGTVDKNEIFQMETRLNNKLNEFDIISNKVFPKTETFGGAQSFGPSKPNDIEYQTSFENSFASRLYGKSLFPDILVPNAPRFSPFHGTILRPFIWRYHIPFDKLPPIILSHILIKNRESPLLLTNESKTENSCIPLSVETVDYTFFNSSHLDQVNSLLINTFWPGIDKYSVIALYKYKLVGCAFLTPDGYLNYIAVCPGWEKTGIGSHMLYFLISSLPSKDITLHVSASNPAMILYQKFGFKPEKFIVDFYKLYFPPDNKQSRHAFFMRLRRV
ncbi:hypothetical protein BB560_006964 [Smittium megazygosporum]|uniref:N-acetyltransferase domain-containing protein n=1 Tax=Smittium megazygosporum TaxID=133381 RepID=A0A2T9XZW8_9FUNG|nr:hypothetical protein BB560_006964 [Smittium megazygosporum]